MNALKNNIEKIVFVLVAIGCVMFAIAQIPESDDVMKTAESNLETIERNLRAKQVSTKYPYHQANQDMKLVWREFYAGNQQRSSQPIRSDIAGWVVYPQPERPAGEQKLPVPVEEFFAQAATITDFKVQGEQGRNIISLRKPEGYKFMELVRIEIYRGTQPDKLEKFETITFGPEEGPSTAEAVKPVAPVAPVAPPPVEGRRPRNTPAGKKEKEIVNPFAGMTVVIDTNIEQKSKYLYKAVSIARMTKLPDVQEIVKNAVGDPEKIKIYRAPKDMTPIAASNPEAKVAIFKDAGTDVREVTTPSNFQIRLSGTSGTVSPVGTPENRISHDYQGNFEVKVWVPEAQSFKEITIQAAPGQQLKGQLSYKTADGKDTKVVDFDAGYQLVEIKWGTKGGEETMADGSKKTSPIIPNEVAVLLDIKTKKMEEFPKRSEFERKSDNLKYYEQLDKERRELEKAAQERMGKAADRVKAYNEATAKKVEEPKKDAPKK